VSEHDDVFEMLDAYALGTLDESQREQVRLHLESCASCRSEYDEIRNVLDVLPQGAVGDRPSAASHERLLARLEEPAPPVVLARRGAFPWTGALAAGFALALLGDAWFAWQFQQRAETSVAVVVPTPSPQPIPIATPLAATPEPKSSSQPVPTAAPSAASPSPHDDDALRARVASLEQELHDERLRDTQRGTRDGARIAALSSELAHKAPVVAVQPASPQPSALPPRGTQGDLVAALSDGHVYGVDGVVGSEPWHLTIVQPPAGANAVIYSEVPHAPAGDTYRTWVVRGGKTFDAGELPAGTRAKLDMPMPLQNGDVVAFSREPIGTGSQPTNPFLMQITIKQ